MDNFPSKNEMELAILLYNYVKERKDIGLKKRAISDQFIISRISRKYILDNLNINNSVLSGIISIFIEKDLLIELETKEDIRQKYYGILLKCHELGKHINNVKKLYIEKKLPLKMRFKISILKDWNTFKEEIR